MRGSKSRRWTLTILVLGTVAGLGQDQQTPKAVTHRVAMSDGVKLATDVYLPGDGTGKYPVIVARTPYNENTTGSILAANTAGRSAGERGR